MFAQRLLTTGLGSLPYIDINKALTRINEYFPHLPFWPQLPKRSKNELMLESFLHPWIAEKLVDFQNNRGIFSDEKNTLKLYEKALEKRELLPEEITPGIYIFKEYFQKGFFPDAIAIKGQVTGPNTLCRYNSLKNGLPLHHNKVLVMMILELVRRQLLWQIDFLQELNLPVIIFIDEPSGLVNFYEPSYELLNNGLKHIVKEAQEKGALIGIHICSVVDWFRATELPIDIISFNSFHEKISEKDLKIVKSYLRSNGFFALGGIPTSGSDWLSVKKRIEKYLFLIKVGGLITASCGLGMESEDTAEKVMQLTNKTVDYFSKYIGETL